MAHCPRRAAWAECVQIALAIAIVFTSYIRLLSQFVKRTQLTDFGPDTDQSMTSRHPPLLDLDGRRPATAKLSGSKATLIRPHDILCAVPANADRRHRAQDVVWTDQRGLRAAQLCGCGSAPIQIEQRGMTGCHRLIGIGPKVGELCPLYELR